jgi:hypothetical protein
VVSSQYHKPNHQNEEQAMSNQSQISAEEIAKQRDAFIERFLGYAAGTFSLFSIYIGERLGYYHALAEKSLTSAELATRTNTHERYAREWLEQQTVAGILHVEDENLDVTQRRFRLPPGHAEPLIEQDSLNYVAPLTRLMAGAVRPLDSLLEAYRTGIGVPFSEYGLDLREGQAAINRPAFLYQLSQEWLPAMPDVHELLNSQPPARVADIGCGYGWSRVNS